MRYKTTRLGFVWAVLEPTLLFLLLYFVFTSVYSNPGDDYGIYLISGLIVYHAFSKGTQSGITTFRNNYSLMLSINIKKEFLLAANAVTSSIILMFELVVLFGIMIIFQFVPPWTIIFIPIVFLILQTLILGITYILSVGYVFVKDLANIWNVIVYALFFSSPIFWRVDDIQGILLEIHKINPLGQLIDFAHKLIVFGEFPSLNEWAFVLIVTLAIFFGGFFLFKKFENRILEEL